MEFRILGPVEARAQDRPIPLGGPRQRALVAVLLLHPNTPVPTEQLLDALWDDEPPRSGAQAVQNLVLRVRKALGADRLRTRGGGYELRVEDGELDLARVEALVAGAGQLDPERRAAALREALAEFRGASLSGIGGAFVSGEAARLEDLRLSILEDRIDADLELGRHADLVGELAVLASQEPLRERVRAQLILALYRSGRQAEALDAYRETRRLLADELGLEPSPALRELERAILQQDPALDMRQRFVPAPTAERRRRLVVVAALAGAGLTLAAGGTFAAFAVTRDDPDAVGAARLTTAMQTSVPAAPVGLVSTLANAGTTTAAKRTSTPGTTAATSAPVAHRPTTTAVAAPTTTRRALPPPAVAAKTRRTTTMTTTAPRTTRTTTTTTTTPTTTAPAAPSSYAIADDFADDFRDGTIWHQIVTGTSVDIRPSGGQLVVSIGADAVPGGPYDVIEGHYGTQCSFPGDFDARVDFELLDWPDGGGVSVGLWAFFANAAIVRKNTTRWGDLYAGWVVPSNGDTSLPDRRGSLRVARVDGTITTFFWHDGSWRTLASGRDRGTAVLGPTAQATRNEFGHEAVRVAFDNFEVDAGEVSCPAGSQPPARG